MGKTVIQKPAAFDLGRLRKDLEQVGWVLAQPKLKGLHLRWNGERLLLAGGDECTGLPHITQALAKHFSSFDLEGEAYWHGVEDEVVSGMARRSAGNLHPEHMMVGLVIFDLVDETRSQVNRLDRLADICLEIAIPPIYRIGTDKAFSEADVYRYLSNSLARGFEGLILRHPEGRWKTGYSAALQKIKPGGEDIYKIVQVHLSKHNDLLESLEVAGAEGNCFMVKASPELDQPGLVGKFARVRYTEFANGKPLASAAVEIVEEAA